MKILVLLSLLMFSYSAFSMELGEYQCLTRPTEGMDALSHRFRLEENAMIIYAFEGGSEDEVYTLNDKTADFVVQPIMGEDIDLGMEFFKYKFFRESEDVLTFISELKYSDSELSIQTTTTITQVDSGRINTVQIYSDDGFQQIVISDCAKVN